MAARQIQPSTTVTTHFRRGRIYELQQTRRGEDAPQARNFLPDLKPNQIATFTNGMRLSCHRARHFRWRPGSDLSAARACPTRIHGATFHPSPPTIPARMICGFNFRSAGQNISHLQLEQTGAGQQPFALNFLCALTQNPKTRRANTPWRWTGTIARGAAPSCKCRRQRVVARQNHCPCRRRFCILRAAI